MGLLQWINDGIEARNARAKEREEARMAELQERAAKAEQARIVAEQERVEAAARHLGNVIALFAERTNQASIPVSAFFKMFKKPQKLKERYVDHFAGTHSGVQTHDTGAAIGSILGAGATAYKRSSLEVGMENFEIARYVYDLNPKEVAMLKIVNYLSAIGRISHAGFHGVTCAILFNGGDCILRPAINPKTRQLMQVTNVQEMACQACLRDNMPSPKAAFDPVFQVAVKEWAEIQASNEDMTAPRLLLGDPLDVIMGQ